jgi:type I restriction enzyme S subunit
MKCVSQEGMAISEGIIRTVNSGSAFRSNDTLLAKITPCLENGKTGFVMNLKEGELARGSTEFIVMRPKEGTSPYFVYCLARSSDFRDTAILSMTGTSGRQRVQTDVLKEYLIGFSENNMKEFNKTASNLFGKIKQNQNQIRNLWNLREALLPKLMSGEVRVKM